MSAYLLQVRVRGNHPDQQLLSILDSYENDGKIQHGSILSVDVINRYDYFIRIADQHSYSFLRNKLNVIADHGQVNEAIDYRVSVEKMIQAVKEGFDAEDLMESSNGFTVSIEASSSSTEDKIRRLLYAIQAVTAQGQSASITIEITAADHVNCDMSPSRVYPITTNLPSNIKIS